MKHAVRSILSLVLLLTSCSSPNAEEPPDTVSPQKSEASKTKPAAAMASRSAFDLRKLIAELNPPTVKEIIKSLEPIPTLDECLAPLLDDPNAPWKRVLTGTDKARVEELEELIDELREHSKYTGAIELAEEAAAIRTRVQGEDHWEAADASRVIETLKFIVRLPPGAQEELTEAVELDDQVFALYEKGGYDDAVPLLERALDIRKRHFRTEHEQVARSLSEKRIEPTGSQLGDGPIRLASRWCVENPEFVRWPASPPFHG